MRNSASDLFILQEQRRFLAQYWKKAFRCLRQEPRQRDFDTQRVLQHFNAPRCSLAERTHAEAQRISLPGLLLHRDHPSEVTVGAVQALVDTADSLSLSETMANNDGYGVAHENCNCVVWECMRAIMIERRSRHRSRHDGFSTASAAQRRAGAVRRGTERNVRGYIIERTVDPITSSGTRARLASLRS